MADGVAGEAARELATEIIGLLTRTGETVAAAESLRPHAERTLGAAEVYGEYLREQHRPAQPEPEWDWSIPHRWYDQARHPGSA